MPWSDNVMVLAKGRLVYSGPSSQLLSSFETENNQCPPKFNPADFVIHTVTSINNVEDLDALAARNRERGSLRFDGTASLNADDADANMLLDVGDIVSRLTRQNGLFTRRNPLPCRSPSLMRTLPFDTRV